MNQALIVRDDANRTLIFTVYAFESKNNALASAALVGRVSNADELSKAIDAGQKLLNVLKSIESARQEAKDPVLAFGRIIDQTAKTFRENLEQEQIRVARLRGDYEALQLAKQRAAEAERRLEAERLEQERLAEERKLREAAEAAQRKLHEEQQRAAAEAAKARDETERAAAQQRLAEIRREQEIAQAKSLLDIEAARERAAEAVAALPVFLPEKADGQVVKEEWVIDQIREFELARARPDLVRKIEFDLLRIKSDLKSGMKLPGVTAHKEVTSSVRAGRQPQIINV